MQDKDYLENDKEKDTPEGVTIQKVQSRRNMTTSGSASSAAVRRARPGS